MENNAQQKKRIKVFQLLEWFELGGGLETIAGEIALGLDPQQFQPEIWCIDRGGKLVDLYRKKGIPVKVLNISSYYNPVHILELARYFKEEQPDIIHTHVYYAATIGRIAAKLAGIKVIIHHVHSAYRHYSKVNLFIEKVLSAVTDKVICVSDHVQEFVLTAEKIDRQKTVVIHNGISKKETFADKFVLRRSAGVEDRDVLITVVASLFHNKGHQTLLEALTLLKNRYSHVKCWIVGEGPAEKELKDYVHENGLKDNVSFLGPRFDIPEILTASNIFVLPSLFREGHPVSILEAMAYGVPVVASKVGGIPEIISDQVNGLLVPAQEPQLLADCLDQLIKDPHERQRLGQEGQKTFNEHFDAKIMIKKFEALYLRSLDRKYI